MAEDRPTPQIIILELVLLAGVAAVAALSGSSANWDPALFGILLGFSVFSDLTAIPTSSKVKISGSFLALVLAMVFLGGAPAALFGRDHDSRRLAAVARRSPRSAQ